MEKDPKEAEVLRTIGKAWEQAKSQLEDLKKAVAHHAELAAASVDQQFVLREKDLALRGLGKAVWDAVRRGEVSLPASLSGPLRALEEAEKHLEAQAREINLLLQEGAETVDRLKGGKGKGPKSTVASGGKKR